MTTEFSEALRAKFTAPLVLIHGLWDDPQSWRRFTGYLSHRGWRCIAVGWPEGEHRQSVEGRRHALALALDALAEPAVLVGHDLGGLIALRAAAQARAVVALAPLVPGASPGIETAGTWLQRLHGGGRSPGRALAASYPRVQLSEPVSLLEDIARPADVGANAAGATPRLIIAGDRDQISPPAQLREMADLVGAELAVVAAGHALHIEDAWEEPAAMVHRWLIRSLGEDLLALYEEAWADRD